MSKSGFTMVELLVVLAIIMVITTISIPTIDAMNSPKHALRKEGRKIMQLMTEARMVAMRQKVQVDLRIDSEKHEVRMVEARDFRSQQLADPYAVASVADTNLYEKVIVFDEDYALESFSADQILTGDTDAESQPFQTMERLTVDTKEPIDVLAISFSHFGGSSGGGITLVKDEMRLNIAADILTGRPKVVTRELAE